MNDEIEPIFIGEVDDIDVGSVENFEHEDVNYAIYRIESDTIAITKQLKELSEALYKHINFIDKTYDGLKNPIEAARKFLRR